MDRVRIVDGSTLQWLVAADAASEEYKARLSGEELRHEFRRHHKGENGTLVLFEMKLPPNSKIEAHSHDCDEIIYVVAGELILGKQSLGPGSSVFITGGTLYTVRSGPNGLDFLNFRAKDDPSHHSKTEHMALRSREPSRVEA